MNREETEREIRLRGFEHLAKSSGTSDISKMVGQGVGQLNAATDIIFNDVMLDALAEEVGFLDYKFKSLAKQINDLGP